MLESVPYARDLVVCSVPADVRRNVALVVSELVANAVKHGSGPVGLLVETDGRAVRIAVRDAGPAPRVDGGDGFGLQIVDRLARRDGRRPPRDRQDVLGGSRRDLTVAGGT